jgi:hypothetical protein
VNAGRSSAAEETAAILQCAAHDCVPVMIPGAVEKRIGHSTLSRQLPPNLQRRAFQTAAAGTSE